MIRYVCMCNVYSIYIPSDFLWCLILSVFRSRFDITCGIDALGSELAEHCHARYARRVGCINLRVKPTCQKQNKGH